MTLGQIILFCNILLKNTWSMSKSLRTNIPNINECHGGRKLEF